MSNAWASAVIVITINSDRKLNWKRRRLQGSKQASSDGANRRL
jgi:hypothetical protein